MTIAEYGHNILGFLSETWHIWLVFTVVVMAGYCWYWYLFEQRVYKVIDNKLFVRHGWLRKWIETQQHLQNDHNIDTEVNQ